MAFSGQGYLNLFAPVSLVQYAQPITMMCWVTKGQHSFNQGMGFLNLSNFTFSGGGSYSTTGSYFEVIADPFDYTQVQVGDRSLNGHAQSTTFPSTVSGWMAVIARLYGTSPTTTKRDFFIFGKQASVVTTATSLTGDSFNYLMIGASPDSGTTQPGINLAHVALWHGQVSDAECVMLSRGYINPLKIMPEKLIGYWPLNDIYDHGPRQNHLIRSDDLGIYPFFDLTPDAPVPTFNNVRAMRFPTLYHFFTSDLAVPMRSRGSILTDAKTPAGRRAASVADATVKLKTLSAVTHSMRDAMIPIHSRARSVSDTLPRLNYLSKVVHDEAPRIRHLTPVSIDANVPVRWAGATYLSAIPIRWAGALVTDAISRDLWLAAPTAVDLAIPVRWQTELVRTSRDATFPVRHLAALAPSDLSARLRHLTTVGSDVRVPTRTVAVLRASDSAVRTRWLSRAYASTADMLATVGWLEQLRPTDSDQPSRRLTQLTTDAAVRLHRLAAVVDDLSVRERWLGFGISESSDASFRLRHLASSVRDTPAEARVLAALRASEGLEPLRLLTRANADRGAPEASLVSLTSDLRAPGRREAALAAENLIFLRSLGALEPADAVAELRHLGGSLSALAAPLATLGASLADSRLPWSLVTKAETGELLASPLVWLAELVPSDRVADADHLVATHPADASLPLFGLLGSAADGALPFLSLLGGSADELLGTPTAVRLVADGELKAHWLVFTIPSFIDGLFPAAWQLRFDEDLVAKVTWRGFGGAPPSVIRSMPVDVRLHVEMDVDLFDPPPVVFGDMQATDNDGSFAWDLSATMTARGDSVARVVSTLVERTDGRSTSSADLVVSAAGVTNFGNKIEWRCQANGNSARYLISFTLATTNGNTLTRCAIITTKSHLG